MDAVYVVHGIGNGDSNNVQVTKTIPKDCATRGKHQYYKI